MLLETRDLIRFEGYVVDRSGWTLKWEKEPIALNRKSFDLLVYLIDHRSRVCSKDELLAALWPDQFIEESNLTQQIFLLRKALSRHESGKKIIETVSGRGYRFTVPVEMEQRYAPQERLQQQVVVSSSETVTQITIEEEELEAHGDASAALTLDTRTTRQPLTVPEHSLTTGGPSTETRPRSLGRTVGPPAMRWLVGIAGVLVLLAVYLAMQWDDPARLRVSTYAQITSDGRAKSIGGTDGSRIYFTQLQTGGVAEVSVSGGVEAPVQLGIEDPWSGDVSPDGSTLLIISQAGGQGPANSLWSFRLVGGAIHHLADSVVSSAWSPDGEKTVNASANGDIFVMGRDGSDAHRIASPGGYLKSLAWSPNGKTIRFSKDGLLWEIALDGTNLHQLLPGWGNSPTQWSGEWAQDGRFFFVADGQIWFLPRERSFGSNVPATPIQLTFGPTIWDRPISSSEGKKIFASGRTRRGELVRFDTKSSQFKPFLAGISVEFVVFSNDGKSVAYVSYPEGVLWRANLDGSHPIQLSEPPLHPKSVRWSPNGSQIAFVDRTADGVDAISVIASDGSGKPHRILPQDREAETDPSWSPDGQKIVFSTSPNVGASAQSDLRVFDLATSKATVLPESAGLLVPRWSPDGRFISGMTLDTVSLRLFDLLSGRWTKLDTGAVAFPEWSHDARWIYYVRWTADPSVLRINASDGRREQVADLKGARYTGTYTLWMGLDPADAPMMLRDEGTDDIYSLTLERR
ncbi:winged helix-turn-helix domain-containing protein [Tunturiibacter lichenicola]|uniref:winged helix-turn-helix domain-containing protein n=1 Tax=Tunturiibacter lichenicola TaxID=2051959 RepID=UPI0021B1A435|nr:winged helix-turn-helix domain-containing protein [Edaphobacter lichenicola]